MSNRNSKAWYIAQRGELLAKELLVELGTKYVASLAPIDVGVDYMAFFGRDDGTTVIFGVEVKATDRDEVKERYAMPLKKIESFQGFNIPVLLILAHVKFNEVHFLWAHSIDLKQVSTLTDSVMLKSWRSAKEHSNQLKKEIMNMQWKIK